MKSDIDGITGLFSKDDACKRVAGIRFASLGSGSKGNGTIVVGGETTVLIDCGFNTKQVVMRLGRLGIDPTNLAAILVTHEHADHVGGVAQLAHRYDIPVYGSYGTHKGLFSRDLDGSLARPFVASDSFSIGDIRIHPVPVPHDAREPTQYIIENRHSLACFGILTDIGHLTPHVVKMYKRCHGLLVEGNHDLEMLMGGKYPAQLKQRISSNLGHLSNAQAASFLGEVLHDKLDHVVVGHISEQNNDPQHLHEAFGRFESTIADFQYATQAKGHGWVEISPLLGANSVTV